MRSELSMHADLKDEELIQRVQVGDESAFTALMSRYSPRVWKVVIANSRQRRDAEEILMDIWRAVWENISGLRNVGSFGAWLQRIAYNACTRYYASVHHSRSEIPQSYADLTEHIDQDAVARFRETELCNDLREAVFRLPDKVRNVAILYYLELWSIKEIHGELGLAIGTIKTQLRQTRELLRKEFGVERITEGIMSAKREGSKHTETRINDEAELIRRILGGDDNAFPLLVEKYQESVYELALRMTGKSDIAEEITQGTFLKAYQKLGALKEPQGFESWLHVIATRRCIDWLRKKHLMPEVQSK